MSAIGPKQTCSLQRTCPLLGVKRTWLVAAHMSAFDPMRTLVAAQILRSLDRLRACRLVPPHRHGYRPMSAARATQPGELPRIVDEKQIPRIMKIFSNEFL